MGLIVRAICVAVLVAQTVGSLVGAAIVFLGEPKGTVWDRLPGLGVQALGIGTMASCLVAIPLGVIGGAVAAVLIRNHPSGLTLRQWLARGLLSGASIGGVGASAYSLVYDLSFSFSVDLPAFFFYFAVGAVAGALSGLIVGAWSFRVVRDHGRVNGPTATAVGAG
jgi:hypothetical protein